MSERLLRALYAIEFCIALLATFQFWSEVGGQAHLDLMPWWWKGLLGGGMAACVVKATQAVGRRRTAIWLSAIAALLLAGGLLTYYEHVNEPLDEDEDPQDQVVPTLLERHAHAPRSVGGLHQQGSIVL